MSLYYILSVGSLAQPRTIIARICAFFLSTTHGLHPYGVFTPESKTTRQDNDKTNVEPEHFYKCIIEMLRFNICLVVVLLWCENTINHVSSLSSGRDQGIATTHVRARMWRQQE